MIDDPGHRWFGSRQPALRLTAVALTVFAGGCTTADTTLAQGDPGPLHVHALAVDPEDDQALLAAAHTGLFRLDSDGVERVSASWHDLMAFTVATDGSLLASGHPALDADHLRTPDRPPHLGLVRSDDGGRTWTEVSLLGEADLHALVVTDELLFGAEATTGRLLASTDRGQSWQERSRIDLVALAADPDGQLLVGSTSEQVVRSDDGGRTWTSVTMQPAVLAATGSGFVAGAPDGRVTFSTDGVEWQLVGRLASAPDAILAQGDRLYAWTAEHRLQVSLDGGETWRGPPAGR
ncbi:MAG: WD40/YVTN/BNR-like repeat-containing protein [Nitriliruptoraceae bacterium]